MWGKVFVAGFTLFSLVAVSGPAWAPTGGLMEGPSEPVYEDLNCQQICYTRYSFCMAQVTYPYINDYTFNSSDYSQLLNSQQRCRNSRSSCQQTCYPTSQPH